MAGPALQKAALPRLALLKPLVQVYRQAAEAMPTQEHTA